MSRSILRLFALVATLGAIALPARPLAAQQVASLVDAVHLRDIGPTRQGGRFVEFAVVESKPQIYYAASATGGLWKTVNNGTTFESVFDNQPAISLGAVAVSQSSPDVVYVGTGEGNNSRSTLSGNGVYKSTDAGATWKFVGLPNSNHIGRIVVDPKNPNIVFVAALGNLYSENPDRGLYRSIDGGTNWTKVLDHKVDGRAIGAIDVVMDPSNSQVLYAATYDKVRRPWSFGEGGPGSGLWKSVNGGTTWTQVTAGLPSGMLGRIGIAIARSDPKTVYVVIENANSRTIPADQRKARLALGFGDNSIGDQMFRTDDGGKTWRQVAPNGVTPAAVQTVEGDSTGAAAGRGAGAAAAADTGAGRAGGAGRGAAAGRGAGGRGAGGRAAAGAGGRGAAAGDSTAGRGGARGGGGGRGATFGANPPYYYGQIRVDPKNKEHVYLLSVGVEHTTDGGTTWSSPFNFGGDNHALWIDPKDSDHMLLGYDHGMGFTYDGGRNWTHADNVPTAQIYAVSYDMAYPYNVYGGLQDNGSKKGPSTRRGGGTIPFEAWYNVGGGDGMFNVVDWKEGRWLYNESQFGAITRTDQWTGETKNIQYRRPDAGGGRGGRGGRGGATAGPEPLRWNWTAPILVSPHNPDMIYHAANVLLRSTTRGEQWEEISPDLTVNDSSHRNGSGNIQFATISTLDESTIVPGLLWVGTDDGNVQVSRNGGTTWTNVRDKVTGHPGYWVSRVAASHFDPAVAYLAITGLRADDYKPYLWKTADYGQTWTSIAGNLPNESIEVIREDVRNPNLLFVGTDLGLYASLDGGKVWSKMKNGFPTMPVYDLQIHPRENEIIVASHGRGIFIGDITPLQGLTPQVLSSDAYLFDIQPTVQWVAGMQGVQNASANYGGESRPAGVAIHYYLKSAVSGGVDVKVYDGARVIAQVSGPGAAGIQTVQWNMQGQRELTDAEQAGRGGRGGRGGGGGGAGGGGGRGGRGGGRGPVPFPVAGANTVQETVKPGVYRVVMHAGSADYTKSAIIMADEWADKK